MMAGNGPTLVQINRATQVAPGMHESKGKTVIFEVSIGEKGSYLLAYRHRENVPFAVVGRFLHYYGGGDAESVVKSVPLNEGEKILPILTGPSASIKRFYKYFEVPDSEKNAVLKAAQKED